MNEYVFNNWNDFGIFCRVNLTALRNIPDIEPVEDFVKACIATNGGCGCTKKKRFKIAKDAYEKLMDFISDNEVIKIKIKGLLNNPNKVAFKNPAKSESDPTAVCSDLVDKGIPGDSKTRLAF